MAHKKGTKLRPPASQEQKDRIAELRKQGYTCADIGKMLKLSKETVAYHARKMGVPHGRIAVENAARALEITDALETKFKEQALQTRSRNKQLVPKDKEQLEQRTEELAGSILVGAERLIESINSMSDEQLAATNLNHKATALGILVDKLRVINNKANPMFGAPGENQVFNIVNIIAAASSSRKKDRPVDLNAPDPIDDAEVII